MAQTSRLLLLVLLFIASVCHPARAQFIDFTLEVDSEITAQTEQTLSFESLSTNSGKKSINWGDVNMGIFSISALENQVLLISLNKPDALSHNNPAIQHTVPIELMARYSYSDRNFEDSFALKSAAGSIKVKKSSNPGPWNSVYIFMYGSIYIGNVAAGIYTNDIVLNVEYL